MGNNKNPVGPYRFRPYVPCSQVGAPAWFRASPRRRRAVRQAFRRPEHRVEQGFRLFRVPDRAVFQSTRRISGGPMGNRNALPASRFPVLESIKRRGSGQGIVHAARSSMIVGREAASGKTWGRSLFAMMLSPHAPESSGPRFVRHASPSWPRPVSTTAEAHMRRVPIHCHPVTVRPRASQSIMTATTGVKYAVMPSTDSGRSFCAAFHV